MNIERDKFLTEAMGEIYLEINNNGFYHWSNNFSTWEGFGKLWEWTQKQDWFCDFYWCSMIKDDGRLPHEKHIARINPNEFANAVYNYLKEQ